LKKRTRPPTVRRPVNRSEREVTSISTKVEERTIRIDRLRVIDQEIDVEPNTFSWCLVGGWFVYRTSLFVYKHETRTTTKTFTIRDQIRPDFDVLTTNLIFKVGVSGTRRLKSVYFLTVVENLKESFSQKFNFGLSECHKKSVVTLVEHFEGE
tara:strand:- start:261 stop:719 length:459 start_codon:yes stop_codon:yes gene_type:complete